MAHRAGQFAEVRQPGQALALAFADPALVLRLFELKVQGQLAGAQGEEGAYRDRDFPLPVARQAKAQPAVGLVAETNVLDRHLPAVEPHRLPALRAYGAL